MFKKKLASSLAKQANGSYVMLFRIGELCYEGVFWHLKKMQIFNYPLLYVTD